MPPVSDAFDAIEIAKKVMQGAGFSFYQIDQARQDDPDYWEVRASTLAKKFRIKISSRSGKVLEFVPE